MYDQDSIDLKIGYIALDGTVYAGISPTTGTKMYFMPCDSKNIVWENALNKYAWRNDNNVMTWKNANKFIEKMQNEYGHDGSKTDNDGGWRLPTFEELKHLYENKDDIGKFDSLNQYYWSSSMRKIGNELYLWTYDFKRGLHNQSSERGGCSVCCIRTETSPTLKL